MTAYLFDLDGTLTDPREGITRSIAYALERMGIAPPPLVVATSKPVVYARRIVEHFALGVHFAEVHGCELDGTREDKRDLIAHILPHHQFDAARAAMIGDRGVDMHAARHHGLTAVGAMWGFGSREELTEAGAQKLCASPRQLPAVLHALT